MHSKRTGWNIASTQRDGGRHRRTGSKRKHLIGIGELEVLLVTRIAYAAGNFQLVRQSIAGLRISSEGFGFCTKLLIKTSILPNGGGPCVAGNYLHELLVDEGAVELVLEEIGANHILERPVTVGDEL